VSPKAFSLARSLISFIFLIFLIIPPCFGDKIYLDQIGYLPQSYKKVVVEGGRKKFFVSDEKGNKSEIEYKSLPAKDGDTGQEVFIIALGHLNGPGKYSLAFGDAKKDLIVSQNPYQDVVNSALHSFYLQRCGTAIHDEKSKMEHPACHLEDAYFLASASKSGSFETTGGWHDAGDYGKYSVPAAYTASTLLLFYSLNKEMPEDAKEQILAEIKYELDWLLTMQDKGTGGVFHKVTPLNFSPFIMPDKDDSKRYISPISSTATADFAGVMAQAYPIYLQYDKAYAKKLLEAAVRAWNFLETHPQIVPAGGFKNDPSVKTGEYGDNQDKDERLFAAVELYSATRDKKYHDYFAKNYKDVNFLDIYRVDVGWPNLVHHAYISYLLLPNDMVSPLVRKNILNDLIKLSDFLVKASLKSGFGVAMRRPDYRWGSNALAMDYAKILIYAYEFTRNMKYKNLALEHLHYVLGKNANDKCFVTGFGVNPSEHIHHRPSIASAISFAGFVPGGPNKNLQDPAVRAAFTSKTPPAVVYLDDKDSWSTNENAIYYNASFVFVAGYFVDFN